jgi:acetyltransferase-like isoleucine patch superfamily enzyme
MSDSLVDAHLISIGDNIHCDPNVFIGYRPGRKIDDLKTSLGAHAQLRTGTVIYGGSHIGEHLQTGHNVVIREQNTLGDYVQIWNNTTIDYGCMIGNHVKIHTNCYIAQFTTIEDDVFIAPGVTIANDLHPGCAFSLQCMRGPTIERGVQIGVNVTIIPRVTIGAYSVIGSGAVVTSNIPPRSLVVGNPGHVIKNIDDVTCTTGIALEGVEYFPYQK